MRVWLAFSLFAIFSIFAGTSVQAEKIVFTPQWQQQFEYDGYSVDTTSTGQLLNTSYTLIEDTDRAIFDFYLLDAATGDTIKSIRSIEGEAYFLKAHNEKVYIVTYEETTNQVSLYDETLALLWSKDNEFGDFTKVFQFSIEGDVILFYKKDNPLIPMFGFNLTGEVIAVPDIAYSVPQIEQCPGELYCPQVPTVEVKIVDDMREINKTLILKPTVPEGHIITETVPLIYNMTQYYAKNAAANIDWTKPDRYFLFVSTENEQFKGTNRILEFNLKGEIIKEFVLPSYQVNFDYLTNGTIFAFAADNQYMRYNLDDFKLIDKTALDGYINYTSTDYDATKLIADRMLYEVNDEFEITVQLERPNELYSTFKKIGQYYIIRSVNTNDDSLIYDQHTLDYVASIPYADDYIDTNNGKDLVSYTTNVFDYSYGLAYYSYQVLNTYTIDKTWTIKFNRPIKKSTVTPKTVYIMNERGEKVNVELVVNHNKVKIVPAGGYVAGYIYTLVIEPGILSINGAKLSQPVQKTFIVE